MDLFSIDYDSSFVKCVSLAPWNEYEYVEYGLTIKEMQMLEIQNIEVKLARFTLRSIVCVIDFILNFASYT